MGIREKSVHGEAKNLLKDETYGKTQHISVRVVEGLREEKIKDKCREE